MNVNALFIKSLRIRSQLYNCQPVRWMRPRKPFWLGTAKSKMFVIREPKIIYTEEEEKINRVLKKNYNIQLKSLMNFIEVENPEIKEALGDPEATKLNFNPSLEKSMLESFKNNDSWNAESGRRRDKRMKESMQMEIEKALQEIDIIQERDKRQMEQIDEIVKKEKELCESYITPENLDESIEKCLNNIDCFDFAIDLEGNRYPGRGTLPPHARAPEKKIPIEELF